MSDGCREEAQVRCEGNARCERVTEIGRCKLRAQVGEQSQKKVESQGETAIGGIINAESVC